MWAGAQEKGQVGGHVTNCRLLQEPLQLRWKAWHPQRSRSGKHHCLGMKWGRGSKRGIAQRLHDILLNRQFFFFFKFSQLCYRKAWIILQLFQWKIILQNCCHVKE